MPVRIEAWGAAHSAPTALASVAVRGGGAGTMTSGATCGSTGCGATGIGGTGRRPIVPSRPAPGPSPELPRRDEADELEPPSFLRSF